MANGITRRLGIEGATAGLGFAVTLAALVLQFAVTIPARMDAGYSALEAVIYFLSFFAVLANGLVALVFASAIWTRNDTLEVFRRPIVRGMAAGAIILVMAYYHLVVAPTPRPQDLFLVADLMLHYVDPVLYVVWWGAFCTRGRLRYRDVPTMLVPSIIYLVYVMIRGEVSGEYPYPILEADRLGYGQVALNIAVLLIALTVLLLVVVVLDRTVARFRH